MLLGALIIGLAAGAVAAGAIAWYVTRARAAVEVAEARKRALDEVRFAEVRLSESRMGLAAAEARLDEWRARLEQAEHELAMRGELLDEARAEAASLRAEQAALTASAEQERKAAQEKLKAIGFEAIVKNRAETVDYFRSEIANWGKMTRAIGFSN